MTEKIEKMDLRGLKCPLPALLARRRLAARGVELVEILTDDPMALVDIPHMCHGEGHTVVSKAQEEFFARFVLRAGQAA